MNPAMNGAGPRAVPGPGFLAGRRVDGRKTYNSDARYEFVSLVPQPAPAKQPAEVEFERDKFAKDPTNGRDLGLICVSAAFLAYEETPQYRADQMETGGWLRRKDPAAKQPQSEPPR